MFKHEGPARSARKNAVLAGYLAFIAGFVNSGGVFLIGNFTSHVTGTIGRLSLDIAYERYDAAVAASLLVVVFFLGAFIASLAVESNVFRRTAGAYAVALFGEAVVLGAFVLVAGLSNEVHPRALDAESMLLCFAMGMQNSMVTRLSGAVVRTTHLTGVLTDLGIEAARWYRYLRSLLLPALPELLPTRNPPVRPVGSRIILLAVIVVSFVLGAIIGALTVFRLGRWAMAAPAGAVLLAAGYALLERPEPGPEPRRIEESGPHPKLDP